MASDETTPERRAFAKLREIRERTDRYDQTVWDMQQRIMEVIDALLELEETDAE